MTQSTHPTPQARVVVPHPYLALMGLYLGGFTGMYSETALNIALPQLSAAFGVDITLAQWLVVGYMLAIGIVLPFASLLLKWVPARTLTLFALGAFLVGALISGCAPTFEVALAGRLVQGIGTGLVLPTMFAMVMEVTPPHKIGAAMGVSALVIMFAPAIGPTLAGFLIGALSWRWVFFSFAVVLVVAIGFVLIFEVNPYELTKPRIDAASVVLSCVGFGGVVLGAGVASLYGWTSPQTLSSLAVGVICLAAYAKRQLGMEMPVLNLRAFSFQGFRVGAMCMMVNFGITLSAMYVLPQYYQNSMLLTVTLAGIVMLPGGVVNALVSMGAGRLFDRIGARTPALVGFALSIVGAALLIPVTPDTPLVYVMACHIVMMVGVPLAMSPCQTHALSSLPPELSTDGSTILNTLQQVLGAVCTAVATSLLALGQQAYYAGGGADGTMAFAHGSQYGFTFTLLLAAVGFVLALRIKRREVAAAKAADQGQTLAGAEGQAHVSTAVQARVGGRQAKASTEDQAHANAEGPLHANAEPTLAELMHFSVFTLSEGDSALDALALFADKGISGAPVLDARGRVAGFVSDGDVIGALARQNPSFTSFYAAVALDDEAFADKLEALRSITVGELAARPAVTVQLGDDVRDVCALLTTRHLKKAPVMDGDAMVGVVNRSDITAYATKRYLAER